MRPPYLIALVAMSTAGAVVASALVNRAIFDYRVRRIATPDAGFLLLRWTEAEHTVRRSTNALADECAYRCWQRLLEAGGARYAGCHCAIGANVAVDGGQ